MEQLIVLHLWVAVILLYGIGLRINDEKSDFVHMDIKAWCICTCFGIDQNFFVAALKDKVSTPNGCTFNDQASTNSTGNVIKGRAVILRPNTDQMREML